MGGSQDLTGDVFDVTPVDDDDQVQDKKDDLKAKMRERKSKVEEPKQFAVPPSDGCPYAAEPEVSREKCEVESCFPCASWGRTPGEEG